MGLRLAFCGAVIATYFSEKVPFALAATAVCFISFLFTLMMAAHWYRFTYLFAAYSIVRNAWLVGEGRTEINRVLHADPTTGPIFGLTTVRPTDYWRYLNFGHPAVGAAIVPCVGTLAWAIWG